MIYEFCLNVVLAKYPLLYPLFAGVVIKQIQNTNKERVSFSIFIKVEHTIK